MGASAMTTKKPKKKPAPRAKPRRVKPHAQSGAPVRDDFSAIIDMIADAKERGAFDPKNSVQCASPSRASFGSVVVTFGASNTRASTGSMRARSHSSIAGESGARPVNSSWAGFLGRGRAWFSPCSRGGRPSCFRRPSAGAMLGHRPRSRPGRSPAGSRSLRVQPIGVVPRGDPGDAEK